MFNVGAGWRLQSGVELRFLVRNLFGKDYPMSPDRRSLAAPGRSGLVTLVVVVCISRWALLAHCWKPRSQAKAKSLTWP